MIKFYRLFPNTVPPLGFQEKEGEVKPEWEIRKRKGAYKAPNKAHKASSNQSSLAN